MYYIVISNKRRRYIKINRDVGHQIGATTQLPKGEHRGFQGLELPHPVLCCLLVEHAL